MALMDSRGKRRDRGYYTKISDLRAENHLCTIHCLARTHPVW